MRMALSTFYGQCDVVLSPSNAADARLHELGIAPSGSAAGTAASTLERFSPAHRRPARAAGRVRRPVRRPADAREGRRPARRQLPRRPRARPAAAPAARRRRPRGGRAARPPRRRRHVPRLAAGDELAAAYASADLFLFCSQTDTFGQVILEAQASGLPVVAVAAGGPAELVADGRSGVLCPPRVDDLADAVVSLAGSRAAPRAARARRARRRRGPLLGGQPRPAGRRLAARARGQRRARARGRRTPSVIEAGLAPACPRSSPPSVVMAALFVLDMLTGDDTVFVPGYVLGPLLVALAAGARPTAAVGVAATGAGAGRPAPGRRLRRRRTPSASRPWPRARRSPSGSPPCAPALQRANASSARRSGCSTWCSRTRPSASRCSIATCGFLRVNDRLAEINGVPAEDHLGRTIGEVLPELPPEVRGRTRARVARTGTPLSEVEVGAAGVERRWVASYWPVRATRRRRSIGVGARRDRGHRAARGRAGAARRRPTATRRCCTRSRRPARAWSCSSATAAACTPTPRSSSSAATRSRSWPRWTRCSTSSARTSARRSAARARAHRARSRRRRASARPCAAATAAGVDLELGGVPLEVEGRRQLVVVVRDVTARRRAEAERERLLAPLRAAGRGQRAVRPVARRGAHAAQRRRSSACATSPTPAWSCSATRPDRVRRSSSWRATSARERELTAALRRDAPPRRARSLTVLAAGPGRRRPRRPDSARRAR